MAPLLIGTGVLALVFVGLLVVVVLVLPGMRARAERDRINRNAQAASWRMHQLTTQTFADMLRAVQEARRTEGPPR